MTMRQRKLVGAVVLLVFVIIYAFFAMVLADMTVRGASPFVQFVFFAVVGLAWVIPSAVIIRFMQRPDH